MDDELRRLTNAYNQGEHYILPRLNRARKAAGLSPLRRIVFHYVKTHYHHMLGPDGLIDKRISNDMVISACGDVQLFPRYEKKPTVFYTSNKDGTTCKRCLKHMQSKNFSEGPPRLHLLLQYPDGRERHLCGGRLGQSTTDPEKVACGGCLLLISGKARTKRAHALNARGRRRARRKNLFVPLTAEP